MKPATPLRTLTILLTLLLPSPLLANPQTEAPRKPGLTREVIWNGSGSIHLHVPVATTDRMLTTAVIFPEEALADVIAGWDPAHISLERAYGQVFLRLLDAEHRGHLDVLGQSGRLYRLYLEPAGQDQRDETVRIVLAQEQALARLQDVQGLSALDLIRAMKQQRIPAGVDVQEAQPTQTSRYPCIFDDDRVQLCLVRSYHSPLYTGHVLQVVNRARQPYNLDLTRFKVSGLMLIAADRFHLKVAAADDPWGHTTYLYLVHQR